MAGPPCDSLLCLKWIIRDHTSQHAGDQLR